MTRMAAGRPHSVDRDPTVSRMLYALPRPSRGRRPLTMNEPADDRPALKATC